MSATRMQPPPPAPPPVQGAGDAARLAGELARARAAARAAEVAARAAEARPALAAQAPRGGVVTNTDQEGVRQTTIQQDGKTTTISTDKDGVVTIRENGKVTVIDPQAIARDAAQAATSALAQPTPLPPLPASNEVPDSVIRLVVIVLSILAVIIIGFPLSRAFARRMDRRPVQPQQDPDLVRRLDRIEQAIETMAVEVERVSEAQRYSAKLLTERLPETPARAIAAADQIR